MIGDGYNYFQEEAHRKALAEQQNQAYLRQQAEQPQQQFKSRGDPSKISNIFGWFTQSPILFTLLRIGFCSQELLFMELYDWIYHSLVKQ